MANKTTNYKLTKPLESEFYDVGVADGLFCREIDGLFCRSSPDSVVRRRCVLSLPSCFVI